MKKQQRFSQFFLVIVFFFSFLILNLISSRAVFARSYTIDQSAIDFFLQDDGSAKVIERRAFNFQGDYRFVYQKINLQNSQSLADTGRSEPYLLTNFELCEVKQISGVDSYDCYLALENNEVNLSEPRNNPDNTFYIEQRSGEYYLQWHYQANDEIKLFELRYQIDNLLSKQDNVAELYWQFVGDAWEVPHELVKVSVWLPKNFLASQLNAVQAWGHGPLSGRVSIDSLASDNGLYGIHFEAAKVKLGQFLEGRIILPLSSLSAVEQLPAGKLNQQKILVQEQGFIEQTIKEVRKLERIARLLFFVSVGLSILGIVYFVQSLIQYLKMAKEESLQVLPGVWEPPSDLEPALVQQLMTKDEKPHSRGFYCHSVVSSA